MKIYDIVCGQCNEGKFVPVNAKKVCNKCGHEMTDDEVENILKRVYEMHLESEGVEFKMEKTGLFDSNGLEICVGHETELTLDDGSVRRFKVKKKTVIRNVVNHPDFIEGTSKVAITGIVFEWEGYDLFPCVDKDGIPDNEKMTIVL